ncbi:DUF429 domain-containing protein [Natronorubrum sp. JWXQ-INN-674]|uniref:DUF429 domain-containing protein n=1 Tax=Natronorubrum halalkaliphilum TaxID=2691917 RepID=A0A6B0VSG9_9EURY|nr:DUF429 domain-containing protein [Natronorubrum halalkaliphilum]MXV63722.1 DUF429 domain-containing protein [Natronorubrum halalkaliphilum]
MSRYVGLDWAGSGWVAVIDDDDREGEHPYTAAFYPSILNAWRANRPAERILVDIPIGLAEDARRQCDVEAREVLGESRSSVFYAPVRDAVYEDEYETAGDRNEAATGNRISTQAYHICPAIREVDGLLRELAEARGTVRESHPEVCFAALAGESGLPKKSTEAGLKRRRELLEAEGADALDLESFEREHIDDRPVHARRLRAGNRDDLLDAFVLAVTARGETVSLPRDPPTDRYDLRMEIVAPAGVEALRT